MGISTFISTSRRIMRGDAGVDGDAQRIAQLTWMLFLKVYDSQEAEWEFHDDQYKSIIPEHLRWRTWAHDEKDGEALTGDHLLNFLNDELFPELKNLPTDPDTPFSKILVRSVFEDTNQYMKDGVLIRQLINLIDAIDFEDHEDRHAFGEIYETLLRELQSAGSAGEYYTPRAVTDFVVEMIQPRLGESVADFAAGTGGFLTSALNAMEPQVQSVEDRTILRRSVFGIEKKPMPYLLGATNLLLHDVDNPKFFHGNSLTRNVRDLNESDKFDVIVMNPPYGGSEQEAIKANFPRALQSSETSDLFVALITYRLKKNGRAGVVLPDGFLFGDDASQIALKERLLREFNLHTVIRLPKSVFAPYTSITTNLLFFDATGPTDEVWYYRLDLPEGYKAFSKTKPMKSPHFELVREWWGNRKELTDVEGRPRAQRVTFEEVVSNGYSLDYCGFPETIVEILSPANTIGNYRKRRAELDAEIEKQLALIESLIEEEL